MKLKSFPKIITIGEKYGPAMEITDQTEADEYFERCVEHSMTFGHDRAKAEQIERSNLGYYAGYYDTETRARVEKFFKCSHPIFGKIGEQGQPDMAEVFDIGLQLGKDLR